VNRSFQLFALLLLFGLLRVDLIRAQDESSAPRPQQGEGRMHGGQEGGHPIFGKITAVHGDSIDIAGPDGQTVTVKLTPQTEFRKDRQPAKISDFKVGDTIMVRGAENTDHTITAAMIGGRTGGAMGPGGGMAMGTLGKDYVAGEVKSIDAPKLTVVRIDNVTQVLELNEDTSLRRGRDSITMADIKVGDHIMARGAAQNDVFIPKGVMVMSPEQWQRFQQMQQTRSPDSGAKPPSSDAAPAPKPQE
jgi:hypothetical protein